MEEVFGPPPLGMSEAEANARFDALQAKLVPLWTSIRTLNQDPQTIVVVPSINVDANVSGVRQQALEERFLFLLLLLRQPRARLVYVTSQAIHPDVVDYYLDLLPGVFAGHARKRLFLVSPLDGSPGPLSRKLLERKLAGCLPTQDGLSVQGGRRELDGNTTSLLLQVRTVPRRDKVSNLVTYVTKVHTYLS